MERSERQNIQLRSHLSTGALSSKALQERLGMSQTALSRAVQRNKKSLLVLGAARSTRYALREDLGGLGSEIEVFEVDQQGKVRPYAILYPLAGNQYGWKFKDEKAKLFDHLPYMLQNIRPEGFMGRAFAHGYAAELGLPDKVSDWSDRQAITALAQRGEDFVGNLIVGKESVQRYLAQARTELATAIPLDQRLTAFEELAEKAIAGEELGSSAGGEQPKFTALLKTEGDCQRTIVKFASRETDEGQRWSDLLVCEYLANEVLIEADFTAAQTEILQTDRWTFLQSERFDRVEAWGRLPLYSLMAVASEFVGYCEDWVDAVEQLYDEQLINRDNVEIVRWLNSFGGLIGNTDMHLGNLSLVPTEDSFNLAPVYDMTPMFYRPKTGGTLPSKALDAGGLAAKISSNDVSPAAIRFWESVQDDPRISDGFRQISQENLAVLKSLDEGPTMRFF
jgi:hypothetical protein